jgi:hypothetical protein
MFYELGERNEGCKYEKYEKLIYSEVVFVFYYLFLLLFFCDVLRLLDWGGGDLGHDLESDVEVHFRTRTIAKDERDGLSVPVHTYELQ